jgi:hypothetical protein
LHKFSVCLVKFIVKIGQLQKINLAPKTLRHKEMVKNLEPWCLGGKIK